MKILSWNVNGIRAIIRKDFFLFLKKEKPDIILLQEIKISQKDIAKEKFDFSNYKEYWNPAKRSGYSGTAILVKSRKLKVESYKSGMGDEKFDSEGRTQTLEFENFILLNVYFPNSNHELSRLDFKLEFNKVFLKYAIKLAKKKPIIIGGDFNVAHQEIDLARPKDNVGNPGFTNEERDWMDKFLKSGFIDTYRYVNKNKIQYSWWSYKFNARARNIGWRVDYFCASKNIAKNIKKAFILDKTFGSGHCPIGLEIKN